VKLITKLLLLAIAINLSGCAAAAIGAGAGSGVAVGTDSRGVGVVIDDQKLEHRVNSVLGAQVPAGSFTVASYNQQILLAGQVPTIADKEKAELAVINTAGVKKVWNYLTVAKNESFSDITHDTYLTSAAKSRLIAQKQVNTNNIKVVTCAGVVYLLGNHAGDKVQVGGAIQGIRQINGVKQVVNLIHF
jgi:osmotically-inducible protein OsmY